MLLGDFATNGMFLPAEEALARAARLPLHRGSHRTYNAVVADALDRMRICVLRRSIRPSGHIASVRGLQRRLRTLLQLSALDAEVMLASRDPFGTIPFAAALDNKTDELFGRALAEFNTVHLSANKM